GGERAGAVLAAGVEIAEVLEDLGVARLEAPGLLEEEARARQIPGAEVRPAQAVDDRPRARVQDRRRLQAAERARQIVAVIGGDEAEEVERLDVAPVGDQQLLG